MEAERQMNGALAGGAIRWSQDRTPADHLRQQKSAKPTSSYGSGNSSDRLRRLVYASAKNSIQKHCNAKRQSGLETRPALPPETALGKRSSHTSRESSGDHHPLPDDPTTKRPCNATLSSTGELCYDCSRIHRDLIENIEKWMSHTGRFDWRGKAVMHVGKQYRSVSPHTTCTLCRQLHAPWIEPFLANPEFPQIDNGDEIHIFRHLRHLPHVSDFQTGRNALRENNAPFHIAVVPVARNWLQEFIAHVAMHGMVVIMPKEQSRSNLFVPQEVPEKFDSDRVRRWLRICRHHKSLCNTEAPEVEGLKMIDCNSSDLIIREYQPGDKYAALSYVWGSPASARRTQLVGAKTGRNRQQEHYNVKKSPKICVSTNRNSLKDIKPKFDRSRPDSDLNQSSMAATSAKHLVIPTLAAEAVSKLPKNVPRTIRDAITVTKELGYRFLWVDKYCINQKDENERQQQCSRMGDIYASAQITIFALGSHSGSGLPGVSSRPRSWRQHSSTIGSYKFVSTLPDPHFCIKDSKWSTRAWTYQEGLFSTRRLFFTDYQVYFECNAMNSVEVFRSSMKTLHIRSGQRFRAYHRSGRFVSGNSNSYSHLNVNKNKANHRKVDIIRRCQFQIRQYTKRQMTDKNDVLNAFAGIARYHAKTSAKIASLAGLPIPFPMAQLPNIDQEVLDYLSYALAWSHSLNEPGRGRVQLYGNQPQRVWESTRWDPRNNPEPQRREGFPSWSWVGWFGEMEKKNDLPYCWTSLLSDVKIRTTQKDLEDYTRLHSLYRYRPYKQYLIRRLLAAKELHFDAHVLDVESLGFWRPNSHDPSRRVTVRLSKGPRSLGLIHRRLVDKTFECVVLGSYGDPRRDIYRAIQNADKKSAGAQKRRIELFERRDPDAIICLIVSTKNGISERIGLLKVRFDHIGKEEAIQRWVSDSKRSFILK